jgi:hypothetical protein
MKKGEGSGVGVSALQPDALEIMNARQLIRYRIATKEISDRWLKKG